MQIFSKIQSCKSIILLKEIPERLNIKEDGIIAKFSDGTSCNLGCAMCKNPRCMYFRHDEVQFSNLPNFPLDKNQDVCPVGALVWDHEKNHPVILNDKCIKCGLCASRCPFGAISLNKNIRVCTTCSNKQSICEANQENISIQDKQIAEMCLIKKEGVVINESDETVKGIMKKLNSLPAQFHNKVARNLLIGLGCNSAMRRIGDVYSRMDAVYFSKSGLFGAIEVEFGKDTLEASRGILDDIAVLNARYNIKKENNNPLVICLQLPNERQGYWQVVKDINAIANIKINTVTVNGLMLLLWNGKNFDPGNAIFYADYDNMNIRKALEKILGRKINISNKFLGILEPLK